MTGDAKDRARPWAAIPAGAAHAPELRPGTPEFFATVRERRSMELAWLSELDPFRSAAGGRVLEVGCGAGYDAIEFIRRGGRYVGLDIARENLDRTFRHLRFFGETPPLVAADAERLPFRDASFDVIFSNGVLHHLPGLDPTLGEIHRALKPGGVAWIAVYNRHSLFHWVSLFLVDHLLHGGFRRRTFAERLSMIENTPERPLVRVYSRRELRRALGRAGFAVQGTWVRKLAREDLPVLDRIKKLWKHIPEAWLDRLGRIIGWYIIVEARK